MILNEGHARDVWSVLVAKCGASRHRDCVDQFVVLAAEKSTHRLEYRFSGNLGFGGKVYLDEPPRVSCYPEDETAERLEMIKEANNRLKELYQAWEIFMVYPGDIYERNIIEEHGSRTERRLILEVNESFVLYQTLYDPPDGTYMVVERDESGDQKQVTMKEWRIWAKLARKENPSE